MTGVLERTAFPGTAARPLVGAGVPAGWAWAGWAAGHPERLLVAGAGFDPEWERAALAAARVTGRALLSLRFTPTELLLGPLWTDAGEAGCAGCAHVAGQYHRFEKARRPERDRAERERQGTPAAGSTAGSAFPVWLDGAVATVLDGAWRPGDLVALGAAGTLTRHRVRATFRCPVCAEPTGPLVVAADAVPDSAPPPAPPPTRRPTTAAVPPRAGAPVGLDPDRMRDELGDPRFGPVVRMTRNSAGAFPMSEVELLAGTPAGIGRGSRFADAEVIGVLEAYERLGGYPHAAPIVVDATRAELGDLAIDPAGLGGYTEEQLAAPTCRIRPYHPDAPLDWVWARPLLGGAPKLVPAEVGFYRYGYDLRTPGAGRRGCFLDSSSGSALGSSFEEAALHSLLELAERDAFLLAWHRARPLPAIDPATVTDPDSGLMLALAADRGYQVHLLVATADIDIPVV
ncbi:MAG TPA: YcaO-like family protein, partial [Rugosimonospora sp.]|nr:YcaO-like family protein [Rugosimonospora sp.]